MRWHIDGILSTQIEREWDKFWPVIEPATKRAPPPRFTKDDLAALCMKCEAQAWGIWDRKADELAAACITMLNIEHSAEPILDIPLLAGRDMDAWLFDLWRLLSAWGRSHRCLIALGYGRKGWERKLGFHHIGFNEEGTRVMAKGLLEY